MIHDFTSYQGDNRLSCSCPHSIWANMTKIYSLKTQFRMSYCCTLILAFLQSSLEVSLPFANSNYACPPLVISLHRKSSSYVNAAESCRYRVLFWACEFGFRANLFMTHRAQEMSSQAAEKVVQSALQTSGGSE